MDTRPHDLTTKALDELLLLGISLINQDCKTMANFCLGPIQGKIRSNNALAFQELTYCLIPDSDHFNYSDTLNIDVLIGDSEASLIPPPWNFPHSDTRHLERIHVSRDQKITAFYDHDRKFWMILNIERKHALFWAAELKDIPFWEKAAPFKQILNWYLANTPYFMMHGGAVSYGNASVLLVGPGGSGKSSTVGSCFAENLDVSGDDLIIVGKGCSHYEVYGIYNSIKLLPNTNSTIKNLFSTNNLKNCGDKKMGRYTDLRANSLSNKSIILALFNCTISEYGITKISSMSPISMMKFVIPPTIFLLRGHEAIAIKKIATMIREVQCCKLELGAKPPEIVSAIKQFIQTNTYVT
jgi:hypothetical protein